MKKSLLAALAALVCQFALSQTCTITVTGDWDTSVCNETGLAPVSGDLIVVPAGVTVTFTTNIPDPKHTGNFEISGKVEINKNDVRIDGNVLVKTGGELEVNEKLRIGQDVSGCGKNLQLEAGALLEFPGSGSDDKLFICGNEIARAGGGGCNPYPVGPIPYCEPIGGFTGPLGFDENGNNPGLPVILLHFDVQNEEAGVTLRWATSSEVDFSKFVIQRSAHGFEFEDIGVVMGRQYDIYNHVTRYSFIDVAPCLEYNYYRLKAVDLDGSYEIFHVRSVYRTGEKSVRFYPNPVTGTTLTSISNFPPGPIDRIRLVNIYGQEIVSVPVTSNQQVILLPQDIGPGIYFLTYSGRQYVATTRVMVHKGREY